MNQDQSEREEDYGENCFEFYDQIYSSVDRGVIDTLQQLANGGRVLELGIGTGRVALPLAARGVDIHGIESSASMLSKLWEKSGGASLKVSKGNFADVTIEGAFSLVFTLVSTFFLLRSPEEQQLCFHTVARELSDRGVFLLENYEPSGVPRLAEADDDGAQIYRTEQLIGTAKGPRKYRVRICYAAPHKLDEMAMNAGLRLRDRWRNWRGEAYTPGDPLHISIYERVRED
jgi:ubiquinone/menaquinone biosynthesis C-methylase UbiE